MIIKMTCPRCNEGHHTRYERGILFCDKCETSIINIALGLEQDKLDIIEVLFSQIKELKNEIHDLKMSHH